MNIFCGMAPGLASGLVAGQVVLGMIIIINQISRLMKSETDIDELDELKKENEKLKAEVERLRKEKEESENMQLQLQENKGA
jgi:hypothetical protein